MIMLALIIIAIKRYVIFIYLLKANKNAVLIFHSLYERRHYNQERL